MFPPIEIQPRYTPDSCAIRVRTGPYSPADLLGLLEIEFLFSPLDPACTRQLHYVAPQLAYTVHPASSARAANTGSFSVCATTRKAPLRRVGHRHPL